MELNWSTFVLEFINFLVLVWILKRFLYKPVLDIIARRRAGIESTLAEADARHRAAEQLQAQYNGRLAEWEKERQQARDALSASLEQEREQRLAALQREIGEEQQKAQVAAQRRAADTRHQLESAALAQAARFATRLLAQASGPELHARLVALATEGMQRLPASAGPESGSEALVTSALPLDTSQQAALSAALAQLNGAPVTARFTVGAELLAGVRVELGGRVYGANLQDELQAFTEFSGD